MNTYAISSVSTDRVKMIARTLPSGQWTEEQAHLWHAEQPYFSGSNFVPSTAINQLEMWQAETFDPETIDRELGWAASLGFNTMRVFLHYLVWQQDPEAFKERIDEYLNISMNHGIRTMFVFFDDCWNPNPQLGPQPHPKPGVHNSGWVQCPGQKEVSDVSLYPVLQGYVQDILRSFAHDERIAIWDLYNEPGNSNHVNESVPLLRNAFEWAWAVRPSQPLTVGIWNFSEEFDLLNTLSLFYSDIVSFHHYWEVQDMERIIRRCRAYNRPVICTEYMGRTTGSRFDTHLPVLRKHNVGAINWGLVSGRSNTIFPWGSPEGTEEPETWFHDIFRADGTPYCHHEVAVIREITGTVKVSSVEFLLTA
ncbi:1,4-beta-xylanase [Larkinella soli]|uniref:1,4-beta-xylanase n=1 Tax=Larkinella soli TaxID=1770527 RepID=UPI0019D306C3|nr:1,4-beta-xylanase [Larkinella soli]